MTSLGRSTVIVLRDTATRIRSLYYVIKSTKNWFDALLVRYGKKENSRAIFRNGFQIDVTRPTWEKYILHTHLFSLLPSAKLSNESIQFHYLGRELEFEFGKYGFDTIFEIFAFDPYRGFLSRLSPKGKCVIDIGAAFGDTAIYFLLQGATRVVGFEAFPGYYRLAEQNIRKNGLADSCEVVLSAVGGEPGSIIVDPGSEAMFGANFATPETGQTVPMVTLTEIVKRYGVTDAFLKLDTEGFEYEILLKTPKAVLRKFSDMMIEYHYGFERLEPYLQECGYSTYHTGPTHVYVPHLIGEEARNMYTGHILAKRID
ncbi:putative SAM-dependent methyltransferase [Nitrospira moscoviensis]|uniref:Putative SAM-dependent methyltransferase n=1 Tax=Nitrospira moscoviensis TaxID=42253 RepID=A0A0K2GGA7_NITMO|nr:putative SAM-dependent methyltransferase [Nitrospira moscoviensis]